MNENWENKYAELIGEIAILRDAILSSEIDDSSEWYSSLMSNPIDVIEWTKNYFKERRINSLTINQFKEIVLPNLHLFSFEKNKLWFTKEDEEQVLIQKDLNIPNWDYIVTQMSIDPGIYLSSVLVYKMYQAILGDKK